VLIPLTQGKTAVIDDEDHPLIAQHKWHAVFDHKQRWYANTNVRVEGKRRSLQMQALILGTKGGDHIDGDGLNNRRSNLRVATPLQNARNKSKKKSPSSCPHKGVTWNKRAGRWKAVICANYKEIHLGYFTDSVEAARAYDTAALKLHGEFAKVNFPDGHL